MERLQTWKDKLLHGQFLCETEEQVCVNHSGSGYKQYGNLTKKRTCIGRVRASFVNQCYQGNIQSSAKC